MLSNKMTKGIKDINNLIVVGDHLLIKPKSLTNKTKCDLFIPLGYKEKEEIQTGCIIKCGPAYPILLPTETQDDLWKNSYDSVKYVPLQAKEGDLAIFMQKGL